MNLWETLRILKRRWPILALVGVLTVGATAFALRGVAPTYESRTKLLLVMPAKAEGSAASVNPYLNFGATLIVTGRVLSEAMTQESVVRALKDAGAGADYAIVPDPLGQSPTLTIVATDPDPKVVTTTLEQVVVATRRELADRQNSAGAPELSWIAAVDVTAVQKPVLLRGDQVRTVAMFVGLGAILALLLAFGAEGWQRRRVVAWADEARASTIDSDDALLSRAGP